MAEKKKSAGMSMAKLADLIADLSSRVDDLSSRVSDWESRAEVQAGKRKLKDYAERAEAEFAHLKGTYGSRFSKARPHFERVGSSLCSAFSALFTKSSA